MRESRACEVTRCSEYLYVFTWKDHRWEAYRDRTDTNESYWLVQKQKEFWADVDAVEAEVPELDIGQFKVMFETIDFRERGTYANGHTYDRT